MTFHRVNYVKVFRAGEHVLRRGMKLMSLSALSVFVGG